MTKDRAKRMQRYKKRRIRRKRGNWFVRLKWWKKLLVVLAVIVVSVLCVGTWYVFSKWDKIDTQEIKTDDIIINKEVEDRFRELDLGTGYTNIALFGVDSREGELGEGTRTDCIIVASLNNETKEIKLASVYRDTLLDLSDGFTYQKCNAAYSYGGPATAINMLNMNLDLNIQDYVTVDFGAIADAIDLLGGLELNITDEEAMYMNEHILGTGIAAGKEVHYMEHGGLQLLDGVQATTYARIRSTAGGDFTRTERQRIVIEKVMEKVKDIDMATLNKIIDKVFPQISTSFTLPEILNYAKGYKEYVLADSIGFPYQDALTLDSVPGVGSVVVPADLAANVIRLHQFLFGTMDYVPSSMVYTIDSNISTTLNNNTSSEMYSEDGYDILEEEEYVQDEQPLVGDTENGIDGDEGGCFGEGYTEGESQ